MKASTMPLVQTSLVEWLRDVYKRQLENVLNSPSMWFFTMNITLVPVLVIGVLYLLLAAVIPLIVLRFFNKGTVVERLRTSE